VSKWTVEADPNIRGDDIAALIERREAFAVVADRLTLDIPLRGNPIVNFGFRTVTL